MNDNELIEKLKNNKKPVVLNTPEEQNFLQSIPSKYLLCLQLGKTEKWERCSGKIMWDSDINYIYTFRIAPDYKPEPEIEKCKVYKEDGVWFFSRDIHSLSSLSSAIDMVDFYRYCFADGTLLRKPIKKTNGENEWAVEVWFRKVK